MTNEEARTLLKEICKLNDVEFDSEDMSMGLEDSFEKLPDGVTTEFIKQRGGEGCGDEYYVIGKVIKGDDSFYVKCDSYYDSWNGTDYTDFSIVEPKEVTVTKYVNVKES